MEVVGPVDFRAVGQLAGGIDGGIGKKRSLSRHMPTPSKSSSAKAERVHDRVA